jgi:ABC-type nitrate/sulfonate/bicarbonate transport system substrate-binding protein
VGIRHATPYHAPLYLAQAKGYFKEQGIKVALLEPNDPSDVTEIIGTGKVDLGFKAMIHTLAVSLSPSSLSVLLAYINSRQKLVGFLYCRSEVFWTNPSQV